MFWGNFGLFRVDSGLFIGDDLGAAREIVS